VANSDVQLRPPAERKTPWAWAVGTFFGAGLLKPGPGTYGSVAALVLWYIAGHVLRPTTFALGIGTAIAAAIVVLIGIPASTRVAYESGREDPGHVVIDEVAGQLITLIGLPCVPGYAVLGLLLFRAFDITKPWPVRRFEALPDGTGIMMDDVAAGILAIATAHVLRHFL
jgi:phosphatidylglycerophosphatase A